ncbi:MAG: nicotinate (nicotinamide) nucleotide adenylyltransferase [Chlamydiae bacterium]|nr:nicotinate (nicotinamide) nucleotide adenylyltransferase [Chlamydiota bacterium]
MKVKKIGFFGGSFDPIHNGHIHLALSLLEKQQLDQVLFCPAFLSPFKLDSHPHVQSHHRLAMTKLAIASLPFFSVIPSEIEKESVSYTIDTVKGLIDQLSLTDRNFAIHLLLGEDMLKNLSKWKEVDKLLSLAPPFIASRSSALTIDPKLSKISRDLIFQGFTRTSLLDISSTDIRCRLKKNQYCGHLIPSQVLEYIHLNRLYL